LSAISFTLRIEPFSASLTIEEIDEKTLLSRMTFSYLAAERNELLAGHVIRRDIHKQH